MNRDNYYVHRWRVYRVLSLIRTVVWCGFPAFLVIRWIYPDVGRILTRNTGMAWLVTCAIAHVVVMMWRCPRCGKPFFLSWLKGNFLARRCLHCGLPKYAMNGSADLELPMSSRTGRAG